MNELLLIATALLFQEPAQIRVVTVILLDYLNAVFKNESLGRVQLMQLLEEMEPNQPVALVALDLGFEVVHDFTTDTASLVWALEAYRPYRPVYAGAFPPAPFLERPAGRDAALPSGRGIRVCAGLLPVTRRVGRGDRASIAAAESAATPGGCAAAAHGRARVGHGSGERENRVVNS